MPFSASLFRVDREQHQKGNATHLDETIPNLGEYRIQKVRDRRTSPQAKCCGGSVNMVFWAPS